MFCMFGGKCCLQCVKMTRLQLGASNTNVSLVANGAVCRCIRFVDKELRSWVTSTSAGWRDSFMSRWWRVTEKQLKLLILFCFKFKSSDTSWGVLAAQETLSLPLNKCFYIGFPSPKRSHIRHPAVAMVTHSSPTPLAASVSLVWWHIRHKGHSGDSWPRRPH